jgi:hypothetical protein
MEIKKRCHLKRAGASNCFAAKQTVWLAMWDRTLLMSSFTTRVSHDAMVGMRMMADSPLANSRAIGALQNSDFT